uniref:Uncharacterized protein n=1 Tax=Oncorhynchus mykiss TaxID=8022 RepID=A0A8C7QGQ2_ONCMY
MAALPVPCPVRLGIVKNGGLPAQLHRYTLEKNLHKMEKLLQKGKTTITQHQEPIYTVS